MLSVLAVGFAGAFPHMLARTGWIQLGRTNAAQMVCVMDVKLSDAQVESIRRALQPEAAFKTLPPAANTNSKWTAGASKIAVSIERTSGDPGLVLNISCAGMDAREMSFSVGLLSYYFHRLRRVAASKAVLAVHRRERLDTPYRLSFGHCLRANRMRVRPDGLLQSGIGFCICIEHSQEDVAVAVGKEGLLLALQDMSGFTDERCFGEVAQALAAQCGSFFNKRLRVLVELEVDSCLSNHGK